MINNTEA